MNHITSPDTSDSAIEGEIQAKGKTAARVTPADIEAAIVGEFYTLVTDYDIGCGHHVGKSDLTKLKQHTLCILTLTNGFTVEGVNNGPVVPSNFDAEIGRKLARAVAVAKIWPLLGYELRSKLAG